MKLTPNIPLKFLEKNTAYIAGKGPEINYSYITTIFAGIENNIFWGEWKNAYGQQILDAQAQGVNELATIRMVYIPEVYEALRSKDITIVKHAENIQFKEDKPMFNQNTFKIYGSVDNVNEENKIIEFKVRRYEQK